MRRPGPVRTEPAPEPSWGRATIPAKGRVVVVGAGSAGVSSARALRRQGFAGDVLMLGDEVHAPYDRPPLSRELLAGAYGIEEIALTGRDDVDLDLDLRLGSEVAGLDVGDRELVLRGGARIGFDGLVIACGARRARCPRSGRPDRRWRACTRCAAWTTRSSCAMSSSPEYGSSWWAGAFWAPRSHRRHTDWEPR